MIAGERINVMIITKYQKSMGVLIAFASLLFALLHPGISASASTGLSGFGARSIKKTIFSVHTNTTTPLSTPRSIANAIFAKERLVSSDRQNLWTKRSREPDCLWFQIRDDDNKAIKTLKISVVDQAGDWNVVETHQDIEARDNEWTPIEGIYGLYKLPSGIVWVLVTKSTPIYSAPLVDNTPWWEICKVSNLELVHLSRPGRMMSTAHLREEVRQLRLLRQSLKEHEFYFVPTSESSMVKDVTHNLQSSFKANLETKNTSSWWQAADIRPDPRFFWNQAAVEPILQRYQLQKDSLSQQALLSTLLQYTLPLTSAFVGVQSNVTDPASGCRYDQLLISRRSRFRAGTRFTRRGADASGAVANFAETEQICVIRNDTHAHHVLSHLQTRGSIPLRWSSPADVKTYRPRIRIGTDPLAQARALRLHLLEQFAYYVTMEKDALLYKPNNSSDVPRLVFVNLIDKKKDQGRLGRAFDAVLKAVMDVYTIPKEDYKEPPPPRLYDLHSSPLSSPENDRTLEEEMLGDPKSVEHIWFDFHAEVKDGRWDRLVDLLNTLKPTLTDHGFFLVDASNYTTGWTIRRLQKAIIRTNCMDCLDRTNVVQSLFGRFVLFQQLKEVARINWTTNETHAAAWETHSINFDKVPTTIPWEMGEKAHRLLWADNADAISRLYAGTAALKGDFTRTGKRTRRGALDDGVNSLQRYYLNNFLDADRQEGMDLLVGYADFTNVDNLEQEFIASEGDDDVKRGDETTYVSIKQAARENFFGKLVGNLEEESVPEIEEQLGILEGDASYQAVGTRHAVDLRWLPGDLHSHMISNVDSLLEMSTQENCTKLFEYSSSSALASIDRRSDSALPWWAEFEDDLASDTDSSSRVDGNENIEETSDDDDEEKEEHSSFNSVIPDYFRSPHVEKSHLLGIVLLGLRAPNQLAMAIVIILGLTFLPDIVVHDILNR